MNALDALQLRFATGGLGPVDVFMTTSRHRRRKQAAQQRRAERKRKK